MPSNSVTLNLPVSTAGLNRTDDRHLRGRMIYLRRIDAIIRVDTRCQTGGWMCHVVAGRDDPLLSRGHLVLSTDTIGEGVTSLTLNPNSDPDGFATLIWHTTVVRHWAGAAIHSLGRRLAHSIRRPGSLEVDLDTAAITRLVTDLHIPATAARNLMTNPHSSTSPVRDERPGEPA